MIATRWRCRRTRRQLQAWLDGETTIDDATHLAAHVAQCVACGREAVSLERVIEAIRRQRPDTDPRVLRQLELAVRRVGTSDTTTKGPDPRR